MKETSVKAGPRSAELFARAQAVLPGGRSRNSLLTKPYPIYVHHGRGCNVVDVDGITRIDFANNMTSLIHGHAHPRIAEAVSQQCARGTCFNLGTELEIQFAELLCARNPAFEQIRFVNSGTEAVMTAIRAARAFTGRPMIAKVEGAYHGSYDYAEVSQTARPANWGEVDGPASVPVVHGTPEGVLRDVVVIPFNDADRATAILDRHRDQIAAVLLDPMPHRVGLTRASAVFVDALRRWADAAGSLLVFDEVITFRSSYGGAQDWYESKPDLTALGKIIGGGFPVGAVAGRRDVMQIFNPSAAGYRFPLSGTFSANPITMTAGLTAMQMFDRDSIARLNGLAEKATRLITDAVSSERLRAVVTGGWSIFRIHFKPTQPGSYRDSYPTGAEAAQAAALVAFLVEHGVIPIETCTFALSTPMTEHEITLLSEAVVEGIRDVEFAQANT